MSQITPLSKREGEVVKHLLQGKSNKLIALALGISDRTVEYHLKNIYSKFQVSSRVELILKLGNTTGQFEIAKPGLSTVESPGESAENRDALNSRTDWVAHFRSAVSMIGRELQMKNLYHSKYVLVGVMAGLFTGFAWVAMLRTFGNMSLEEIKAWLVPMIGIWVAAGLSIGLVGKWNGSTLQKVFFSTLFGTGLSPIAILPVMGFVVLPLGKFAERLGLMTLSTLPRDVAEKLAITGMLGIWLILGIAIGIVLLFLAVKKPGQPGIRGPASEPGL